MGLDMHLISMYGEVGAMNEGRELTQTGYLEELSRELDRAGVEADVARALLEEVALHLEAETESRIELGTDPAQAEREAVAAFGPARLVARRAADVHEPVPAGALRRTVLSAGLFLGSYAATFTEARDLVALVLLVGVLGGLGCLAVSGYRARRVQWLAFVALAVPTWLAVSVANSVTHVTLAGCDGPVSRSSLPTSIPEWRHNVAGYEGYVGNLRALHQRYLVHGGRTILHGATSPTDGIFRTREARSDEDAARFWQGIEWDAHERGLRMMRETLASMEANVDAPFYGEIPNQLRQTPGMAAGISVFALVVHALGVLVRQARDQIRRRRPRRRVA
jgi:hypothetical protein